MASLSLDALQSGKFKAFDPVRLWASAPFACASQCNTLTARYNMKFKAFDALNYRRRAGDR
jgi:hypothetical protein